MLYGSTVTRELRLSLPRSEDTREAGGAIARVLVPGDVVVLGGELGAGKTAFVQGAALALGVREPVVSPTFTLVREYEGRWPLRHVDVYRLERLQEVIDLGYEELLEPGGVTFVEWGDTVLGLLPEDHLRIDLTTKPETEERVATVAAAGAGWGRRWERIEAAVERWSMGPAA